MCGICGIVKFDNSFVASQDIKEMCNLIAHRGPDAEGIYINNNIGLGHRRLSIIDLSESANQPMISGNGRYAVVYNGEIYNYKELSAELINIGINLKTRTDTEVLLELFSLYGLDSINKLRGMFAIAIWDLFNKKLFLIRDRVGIKPLYYTITNNEIIFSSEIKAILSNKNISRNINIDSFWKYCRNFTIPTPESIIKNIKKLEPGTILECYETGKYTLHKYWDIKEYYKVDSDIKDANTSTEKFLEEAVRMHTISDVPIGSYLSGGLDSSLITLYMNKYVDNLNTYSMSFNKYDETEYANYVSNLLGTKHDNIEFSSEMFHDNIDKMIWHCDEPFAISSSFGIFILSKFASQKLKVVMTGDGADELFGGYGGFLPRDIYDYGKINTWVLSNLERLFSSLLITCKNNNKIRDIYSKLYKRTGSKSKKLTEYLSSSTSHSFVKVVNREYFESMINSWNSRAYSFYYENSENLDEISRKMYAEVKTRLVDEMLTKTDRMTMAHSLEARVPFLDTKVVEYSCSLPVDLKIRISNNSIIQKYILKKISEKYFYNDFVYRKKSGFDIPYSNWLQDKRIELIFKEAIMDGELIRNKVLDSNRVYKVLNKEDANKDFEFILAVGIFELWQKMYSGRFGKFSFN